MRIYVISRNQKEDYRWMESKPSRRSLELFDSLDSDAPPHVEGAKSQCTFVCRKLTTDRRDIHGRPIVNGLVIEDCPIAVAMALQQAPDEMAVLVEQNLSDSPEGVQRMEPALPGKIVALADRLAAEHPSPKGETTPVNHPGLVFVDHQRKRRGGMWAVVILFLLLGLIGSFLPSYFHRNQLIEEAYQKGEACINARSEDVMNWYLGRKAHTKYAADSIVGMRSKWILIWETIKGNNSQKALNQHVAQIVQEGVLPPDECRKMYEQQIRLLLQDLLDIEDELARKSGKPNLSVSQPSIQPTGRTAQLPTTDCSPEVLKDLVILVGSEVAGEILTHSVILSISTLSAPETLGVGLLVGLVVDVIVQWIVDPAEDVAKSLDAQLEKTAAQQAEQFRSDMREQVLDRLRTKWKNEL